jgi:hypothetical protein
MPNDRLDTFQNLIDDEAEMSAGMVTFRKCLETSSSVAKCLEQDDLVQPSKGATTPRSSLQGEQLLAAYDERFEDFIATNHGKTVKIQTINPTDCPRLRDEIEEQHFVDWWIDRANEITTAPALCSSADWKRKVADKKALIESAVSCGNKLGLRDIPKLADATFTIETLSRFRCNQSANAAADIDRTSKSIADFMDSLESTISKLKTLQTLVGDQPLDSIIDAFEMVRKSRIAACGTARFRQCIEEYRAKGSLLETISKFSPINDLSIFSMDKEMVRRLSNLNNTLIDMAICDLLQDEEFAKRTSYSREQFCDSHKLQAYRAFGSSDLGRSLERADEDVAGKRYSYQLGKTNRDYLIQLPLGDLSLRP